MKNIFHFLIQTGGSVLLFVACANATLEKGIDQKISQENEVQTRSDLNNEVSEAVENAKDVTPEQKIQLFALRSSVRQQIDDNWQKSLKLKSVLIKELITSNYNENEVSLIKQRLKKLESQRLAITFDAIDQTNKILGRQAKLNRAVMTDFIRLEHD